MTFKKAFEETFCSKKNVAILNHCWENCNFGAVLTGYALNKVCKLLGVNHCLSFAVCRLENYIAVNNVCPGQFIEYGCNDFRF